MLPISTLDILKAYLHYTDLSETDCSRFLSYQGHPIDEDYPLAINLLLRIEALIHEYTNEGFDDSALIDFLVDPSFEAVSQLMTQYPSTNSTETHLKIILWDQFRTQDWHPFQTDPSTLEDYAETIISILFTWELMEWTDVVPLSKDAPHILHMYPTFANFITTGLNIYADNIGFDAEHDTKLWHFLHAFVQNVLEVSS